MIVGTTSSSIDPRDIGIAKAYEWATRYTADGWKTYERDARIVHCPNARHPDAHPSCKIHLSKHLWHCYSCGEGGGILQLIVAAGVLDSYTMGANPLAAAMRWLESQAGIDHHEPLLAHAKPKPHQTRKKLRNEEQTATFFYCDYDGTIRYRIVRIEGLDDSGKPDKRFEAHAWQNNKFKRGMFGEPPIPYRLPDIARARLTGEPVILVEGERDADVLSALGFIATSSPFGASFVIREEWKDYFVGITELVIVPDADMPGRRAAERRARTLAGSAGVVRIVDPWPADAAEGYDTSDFVDDLIRDGHTDRYGIAQIISEIVLGDSERAPKPIDVARPAANLVA